MTKPMLVVLDNCKRHLISCSGQPISATMRLSKFLQNFSHTNLMNKSWLLYNISISQSLAEHCTNEYFNCLIYMFCCKSEVHKIGISFFYKMHIFIYADPIFVIVIWFILYRAIYTHDAMGHMTNIDVHVYVLQEL